ncbi:MAG: hypothetical protein IPJ75_08935 [Ignavibacteriales bacterium]|nr:hypothetical protein [Ignavibacteriales bacterium]
MIDRNRFRISLNNNCLLPAVDPNNRESLLSIGAFTENLVLSANKYGYATELKMLTENPYSEDIMEVKLSGDRAIPFQMQKIINRRTVRNGYSTREIKAEDFAYITNNDTNHFHYFTNESKEGRYMSQGTIEANRIQAFRTMLRKNGKLDYGHLKRQK